MKRKTKLVAGWGVNDVDYEVQRYKTVNGVKKLEWVCPYYKDWKGMVYRCHDLKFQENNRTYVGCTICEDWKYFSNFIKWVDSQPNRYWQNCSPDKDFILFGNKHYSPETVVYIPKKLNSFITDRKAKRGEFMIGVTPNYYGAKTPFVAQCCNPFNTERKSNYVGCYSTELEAHKAWQAKKHEYACRLAEQQQDPRVAKVLMERYAPDKDWTNV